MRQTMERTAPDQAEGLREIVGARRTPLRVVAVTSGKGGVGKTSVAANLAVLAARDRRVLLLDADLGLANVEILYGLTPRFHLGHVLEGKARLEEALVRGPGGVALLSAGAGAPEASSMTDEGRQSLLTALEALEDRFDLVLVDSAAGVGENVLFFAGAAQEAVLVISPEPTSLSDAYAAVKSLSQRTGLRHFRVLVNTVPSEDAARRTFEKLAQVTGRFLSVRLSYLGSLPRDENVGRAVLLQKPVVELFPRAPFCRALQIAGDALLDGPPPAPVDGGLKFLWQRLLRESSSAHLGATP